MRTIKFKVVKSYIYAVLLACFMSLPVSFLAFGSDLQTQQSPLYPFRSSIFLQDEFTSGGITSGQIGSLGWNSTAGITSFLITPSANRIGVIRRDTSSTINTFTTLYLYQASSSVIPGDLNQSHTFQARLNNNDANTTARLGVFNLITGNPPANGIYLEKLDTDTNWFCVTRAGSVQTRTNSTIAVDTNFNQFGFVRNSSGVTFTINYAIVCTHTTNISAASMTPGLQINNSAAASKTIDLDYYQLIIAGFSR